MDLTIYSFGISVLTKFRLRQKDEEEKAFL